LLLLLLLVLLHNLLCKSNCLLGVIINENITIFIMAAVFKLHHAMAWRMRAAKSPLPMLCCCNICTCSSRWFAQDLANAGLPGRSTRPSPA
jgi:hypothetical protein